MRVVLPWMPPEKMAITIKGAGVTPARTGRVKAG